MFYVNDNISQPPDDNDFLEEIQDDPNGGGSETGLPISLKVSFLFKFEIISNPFFITISDSFLKSD